MHNPFLIGERVYLRPIERADAATFARFLNDPDVRRTLRRQWPLSLADEEAWIGGLVGTAGKQLTLALCARDDDRLLGCAGFHVIDWEARNAAFGIVVGEKDAWNKGFGTEATRLLLRHAFATLNLERVYLEVFEFNERAIHVYEKVGFVREGRQRRHLFREGRYWDVILMGVLREEWHG